MITKITGRLHLLEGPRIRRLAVVGEAGRAGGSSASSYLGMLHSSAATKPGGHVQPRDSTQQNWPLCDCLSGRRPGCALWRGMYDIICAVWTCQCILLCCTVLQSPKSLSTACCNDLPASIFAHTSSLQSLFLAPALSSPSPETGFHLHRALATARRLAVLETLVPNPPNPPIPPPSTLNGKDQAHSTLLRYMPLLRSA